MDASAFCGSRPWFGAGANSGPDQNRYMFWASRARVPSGSLVTAASGTQFVMTKLLFGSPQYEINKLRLHLSGFASTEGGNSPQETTLPGNAMTINGVWVEVGGVLTRATFGGANGTSIASGSTGAWTDEIVLPSDIPAESLVAIYTSYSTAVGEKQIPLTQLHKERGERVWGAGDAASLEAYLGTSTASTTSLDTNYGATSQPTYYGPDMMAAKGWDGRPVALVVGDSIGERQNDHVSAADARGNLGWLRRWLDTDHSEYGRTPHFMFAIPGASSARELSTSSTLRWDVLDELIALNGGKWPMTCVLDQMGVNDTAADYPTLKTAWLALLTRIRARYANIPVIAVGTTPRSTSTDNFLTEGNQTPATAGGLYPLGQYYQLDSDKRFGMDGAVQGFIDLWGSAFASLAGKWPAAPFTTTLAADTGSSYTSISLTAAPALGDLLRWGTNGAVVGNVIEVSGSGPYTASLDRTNTTSVSSGGTVFAPASADGVHPRPREAIRMAGAVPASAKAQLSRTTSAFGTNITTNGDFSSALTSGWTAGADCALVSGSLVITYASIAGSTIDQQLTTEAGAVYEVETAVGADTTSGLIERVGTTQGGTDLLNATETGVGVKRRQFTATGTTTWLRYRIASGSITLDNVQVRKVLG